MSQPKNRRRRARRFARAERERNADRFVIIHVSTTGTTRNPLGRFVSLDTCICVGFGSAVIRRDGEVYEDGDNPKRRSILGWVRSRGEFYRVVTLRSIEKHIKRMRAGHHRWTAEVDAPLWSAKWERQRPGKWVCIEAGEGFA